MGKMTPERLEEIKRRQYSSSDISSHREVDELLSHIEHLQAENKAGMDYKALRQATERLLSLPKEELRKRIDACEGSDISTLIREGGFLDTTPAEVNKDGGCKSCNDIHFIGETHRAVYKCNVCNADRKFNFEGYALWGTDEKRYYPDGAVIT